MALKLHLTERYTGSDNAFKFLFDPDGQTVPGPGCTARDVYQVLGAQRLPLLGFFMSALSEA